MATGRIPAQPEAFKFDIAFTGSASIPTITNGIYQYDFSNATNLDNLKAKMVDAVEYLVVPLASVVLGTNNRLAMMTNISGTFTKVTIGNSFLRIASLSGSAYAMSDPTLSIMLIPT